MKAPSLVAAAVPDRLVAMIALRALDVLLGAHLSGDEQIFEDRFQEAKSLVLSARSQELLAEFKGLEGK